MRRGTQQAQEVFGQPDVTSAAMRAAVERWYALYYDDTVSEERDASQRLPYAIVNKLARTMFSEYRCGYKLGGEKAADMARALARLDEVKMLAVQHAMIGGECLIKPVAGPGGVEFAVVPRGNYCVLGRDGQGRITSVGLCELAREGGKQYTLVEKRTAASGGRLRVENRLYASRGGGGLGSPVPLWSLAQYAQLVPVMELELGCEGVGLSVLRMPMANCVDASPDGVAVFEAASGLIEAVYALEAQLKREFGNAESRVIASADLLGEAQGKRGLRDSLFVALDEDPANVGITIYSPAIRDESYLNRKNDLLRGIESVLGLKRGILSEANASERTATEITSSSGDYNMTITALQRAWHGCLLEAMQLADRLGQLYLGWSERDCGEPVVDFGDGALYNRDRVWQEYCTMVDNGWLRPEIALGWYFDMPADTAEEFARIAALMPGAQ